MSAPGKLVRSSRWKTGPSKGQRPLGNECCVAAGDSGCEAYTAIAWGVGLSPERSDIAGAEGFHSLEVAGKPTNKAAQPPAERSAAEPTAAEPVERTVGTKGNADQQSTHRTQSRASASQALERIRKVFAVTHPRWEPYAGKPHVRICAGGAR
jgi:hypothetical protein